MKDYVLELVSHQTGLNAKMNTMREYLQAYGLRIMRDEGVFRTTAFVGGTALRFLYGLPRFSEDLDFSAEKYGPGTYTFERLMKKMRDEFTLAGYDMSLVYNDKKTVHSAFLRFRGLMYEAGMSQLRDQKVSIKIEIDTKPPKGAVLKTDIVNKYFPLSFLSYDIPSMFAGKVHALMSRGYAKGRDFFDLGWYLSRWKGLIPNMGLLQNALRQTEWGGDTPTKDTWAEFVTDVVNKADWDNIHRDVESFLENPGDLNVFSKENLIMLLGQADKKI